MYKLSCFRISPVFIFIFSILSLTVSSQVSAAKPQVWNGEPLSVGMRVAFKALTRGNDIINRFLSSHSYRTDVKRMEFDSLWPDKYCVFIVDEIRPVNEVSQEVKFRTLHGDYFLGWDGGTGVIDRQKGRQNGTFFVFRKDRANCVPGLFTLGRIGKSYSDLFFVPSGLRGAPNLWLKMKQGSPASGLGYSMQLYEIDEVPPTCLRFERIRGREGTYNLIYNNREGGGSEKISFYRPWAISDNPRKHFVTVGHFPVPSYGFPDGAHLLFRDDSEVLKPPIDYQFIWDDYKSGAKMDGSVWRPVPPPGFVALGFVASSVRGEKPPLNAVRCVARHLVTPAKLTRRLYSDSGSGARHDLSIWGVTPADPGSGFPAELYIANNSYARPAGPFYSLRLDTPEPDPQCQQLSDQYAIVTDYGLGLAPSTVFDQWDKLGCTTMPSLRYTPPRCKEMQNKFNIIPGENLDNVDLQVQGSWNAMKCDTYLSNGICKQLSDQYAIVADMGYGFSSQSARALWAGLECATTPSESRPSVLCQKMSNKFNMKAGGGYGSADIEVKGAWNALECTTDPVKGQQTCFCQQLSDQYAIVSGKGFGFSTDEVRAAWGEKGCDTRPYKFQTPELCQKMSEMYNIIPGVTFGSADSDVQGAWTALGCNYYSSGTCQQLSDEYAIVADAGYGFAPIEARTLWGELGCNTSPSKSQTASLCQKMKDKYNIIPGSSFGSADKDVQGAWKAMGCLP